MVVFTKKPEKNCSKVKKQSWRTYRHVIGFVTKCCVKTENNALKTLK